ncbi:MAG: phosphatase PAP2 family protein [Candidatus Eisenbacteria bacterium]
MTPGLHGVARTLGTLVLASMLTTLDQDARDGIQHVRGPAFEPVMRAATSLGQPRIVFAVMVAVAVVGGPTGPAIVREAVVALAPANLVVEGLKRSVHRTRPDGSRDPNNASFPSSHAANACALAWLVTRRWRRAAWVAWPLALLVCASRMWLDRHYLSDVLVGAGIGIAAAWWASGWARGAGREWVTTGRYGRR